LKIPLWWLLLVLISLALFFVFFRFRPPQKPEAIPARKDHEIAKPGEKPEEGPPAGRTVYRGRVAIVIDDMGFDRHVFKEFVKLGIPITFSILPGERFSADIAEEAKELNFDVMLHLPMEPHNPKKIAGNGMIYLRMSPEEMLRQLSMDLDAVPHIVGVNNHMGSLLTENRDAMTLLLEEIQKRGLFFLDSKTSPDSVAYDVAKSMGIKSGKRDVFIDNLPDEEYIKGQIDKVIEIAKKKGEATAIGHPRPSTVAALREKIPDFEREGIAIVPLSEVVD